MFDGQISKRLEFSINGQAGFDYLQFKIGKFKRESQKFGQGVGNRLTISKHDILDNLREVQTFHKLAPMHSKNISLNWIYLLFVNELNGCCSNWL